MTITTLKNAPHLAPATLKLIEKAFQYQSEYKFATDFAPLVDPSNHHNCFVITENEKVIAHIGVCERKIGEHNIAMLGGIAVDEAYRGQGHFQDLMQDVLADKRSDVAFFILWSDMEKLYTKYGFHLCGTQLEVSQTKNTKSFNQGKYHTLTENQKKDVQGLYQNSFSKTYKTIERSQADWAKIEKITSADLFFKEQNNKITDYFFMNKGQDLTGIIYEYGSEQNLAKLIQDASAYGKVWMGTPIIDNQEAQYQFFLAPGDTKQFAAFVMEHTNNQMSIRDINPMKQEVYFDFNDETLGLEVEEFLRGIFGPGVFEELGDGIRPLFISGLESI